MPVQAGSVTVTLVVSWGRKGHTCPPDRIAEPDFLCNMMSDLR